VVGGSDDRLWWPVVVGSGNIRLWQPAAVGGAGLGRLKAVMTHGGGGDLRRHGGGLR
jgi:hypothetical protein